MKKIIRLTENDLHKSIKESVNRVLKESSGEISTYYGSRKAITMGGKGGYGNVLGPNIIYLSDRPLREYGEMIPVDVDTSNFFRARDIREAQDIAKHERDNYSGVIYPSRHDGEVCAVFDPRCIVGQSSF